MLSFPRWKIAAIIGICLLAVLMAVPNFLSRESREKLPGWADHAVNLGLDLQGGSYLLMGVDFDAWMKEQLANLTDDVRAKLRAQKIGYKNLSQKDNEVNVTLRGDVPAETDVKKLLSGIDEGLSVEQNGENIRLFYTEAALAEKQRHIIEQSLEIVARRVDETGTREPIIQRQGADRILIQVPGLSNPEHLKELLGRTAKLTFHMVDISVSPEQIEQGVLPPGVRVVQEDTRGKPQGEKPYRYAIQSRAMLSGDMLVDARPSFDENGSPVISFRLNPTGAQKFGEITTNNVGKPFAAVLDNRVITAPRINGPILGGSGIITGNFTTASAQDLSLLLRAGALPAPLKVIEERSVGPSLGADSIAAGVKASIIGTLLVVVFMVLFYGLFGFFATIAMIVNGFMVLALLSLFQATLTLPGIAGIVLTLGMAVDANVLIYERIREELRNGKTPFAATESGFRLAFATILDSHVTTLSAALILFYFGTGVIKGFAVTLSIGIVCSLFTAVLVTRMMVAIWLKKTRPKVLVV